MCFTTRKQALGKWVPDGVQRRGCCQNLVFCLELSWPLWRPLLTIPCPSLDFGHSNHRDIDTNAVHHVLFRNFTASSDRHLCFLQFLLFTSVFLEHTKYSLHPPARGLTGCSCSCYFSTAVAVPVSFDMAFLGDGMLGGSGPGEA